MVKLTLKAYYRASETYWRLHPKPWSRSPFRFFFILFLPFIMFPWGLEAWSINLWSWIEQSFIAP